VSPPIGARLLQQRQAFAQAAFCHARITAIAPGSISNFLFSRSLPTALQSPQRLARENESAATSTGWYHRSSGCVVAITRSRGRRSSSVFSRALEASPVSIELRRGSTTLLLQPLPRTSPSRAARDLVNAAVRRRIDFNHVQRVRRNLFAGIAFPAGIRRRPSRNSALSPRSSPPSFFPRPASEKN